MLDKTLSSLQAINHAPMHEVVYDQLRDALSSGEMMPGQRLVIRDLADMLGTSVMPVREALRRLEAENALEAVGGRTLSVPILSADEYEELCLIRAELEGMAAYEAATRITPEELAEAEKFAKLADKAAMAQDTHSIAVYNRLFHHTVNHASKRPLLLRMIESLWLRVGPQITYAIKNGMVVAEWGRQIHSIFHPHHQALEALKAGNAQAAKAAIEYDINCVGRAVVENMRAHEQEHSNVKELKVSRRKRKKSAAS